ncbi:cleavage polyadenylation factor subunit FIP1 PWA37_003638 [Arxiozyma heterogenica]|uniref:cleavage polyadenylation factor subunit FIP1 n=1 Tax=Arxiozyma heterogenica TaxID=278026 RepID=UPI002F19A350
MESSDEDEKFLYGSDNEDHLVTNQKLHKVDHTNKNETSKNIQSTNPKNNTTTAHNNGHNNENISNKVSTDEDKGDDIDDIDEEIDNDEEEAEEDDEYNVEFIISLGPDTTRLDARSKNITGSQTAASETISVVSTESTDISGKISELNKNKNDTLSINEKNLDVNGKPDNIEAGSIDLDKDGLFDGRPITEIDPEVLKEKPWRQPGANISDYFNFGFNEYTWTEYLHRQERLRDEYNPRRILMGLLTLQQQGKLDIKTNFDPNKNVNSSTSSNNMINNNSINNTNSPLNINNSNNSNITSGNKNIINTGINNPSMINTSSPAMPQAFPTMPMFGGFAPFGMPGILPINPQPNIRNNSNNNNTINNNTRNQQR